MKCALVTGASSGIGSEIAWKIGTDYSYHVLVNYHSNKAGAEETVRRILQSGGSAEAVQFDVTDFTQVATKLAHWLDGEGADAIELVVNNAGIIHDQLMIFVDPEAWSKVINVKLNGFFNVTQLVMKKMLLQRYGRVINIASMRGLHGAEGQVNYSAANGGLIAATKALAREVAKRNITVNAIAPGFIETDMLKDLDQEKLLREIPARRFGKMEEVADLVSFLASPNAAYINGEVISITGGF